jgi:hypothetical protein
MTGDSSQGGFKVHDRRIFSEEGELRADRPEKASKTVEKSTTETDARESRPPGAGEASGEAGIDFSGFVLSLATTGMVHLGAILDPVTRKKQENLPGARQMIEILSVLRDKTRGNLSAEEARLLDGLIYEMQMGVMRQSKSIKL